MVKQKEKKEAHESVQPFHKKPKKFKRETQTIQKEREQQ